MSRQVSTTQGMSVSVPFAQFLHPLGRVAWCATTLQCKTDHRPRSKWVFGEWHPLSRLLTVQPRQQPGSKPLIETGNALDGKINRAHGWKLDHPAPKSKGWIKRAEPDLSATRSQAPFYPSIRPSRPLDRPARVHEKKSAPQNELTQLTEPVVSVVSVHFPSHKCVKDSRWSKFRTVVTR